MAGRLLTGVLALMIVQNPLVLALDDFYIKTDNLKYQAGQIIKVNVYPDSIRVKISYGNEVKYATKNAEFNAKTEFNKITAEYQGKQSEVIIFVSEKDRFKIFMEIIVFGLLNYFLYVALKKYLGGFV